MRKAPVDVYRYPSESRLGEPADRAEEPATAAELEPSRPTELELKKMALAIPRLPRWGEL
jgi:hypothetical protein